MRPLRPEELESIVRRLDFLRVEAGDIPRFGDMTKADYLTDRDRRRSLERLAENVVNAGADIAKIVLSAADLPVPETYRDSMLQLGVAGILEADLANEMAEMARLRNVLAHQYLNIRWESLRAFVDHAPATVRRFIDAVERLVS